MSQPPANVTPRFLFGAGEAADHVVRLLEWMNFPWQHLELFDGNYPSKLTGPAQLPVKRNGDLLGVSDRPLVGNDAVDVQASALSANQHRR